ncbi:MAG: hypothetical protein JXK07_03190 [Spirochaetes bacterium]|nr:hypothetical protein [Spirochaetota bacterium]
MPKIIFRIQEILKYEIAGHPISGLKWTRKTTEKVARQLKTIGINVSPNTVCRLLKDMGFSLRINDSVDLI